MRSDSSDFEFAAAPASGNGELNLFFRDSALADTRRPCIARPRPRPSPLIIERVRHFMQNSASSLALSPPFLCSRSPNALIGTFYGQTS